MKKVIFTDLDLDFVKHPTTKDVSKLINGHAVLRSVRNLVFTRYYDTPFNPTKGNWIAGALFENDTLHIDIFVENEITKMIKEHEPRVGRSRVTVDRNSAQPNAIKVDIEIYVVDIMQTIGTSIILNRAR